MTFKVNSKTATESYDEHGGVAVSGSIEYTSKMPLTYYNMLKGITEREDVSMEDSLNDAILHYVEFMRDASFNDLSTYIENQQIPQLTLKGLTFVPFDEVFETNDDTSYYAFVVEQHKQEYVIYVSHQGPFFLAPVVEEDKICSSLGLDKLVRK